MATDVIFSSNPQANVQSEAATGSSAPSSTSTSTSTPHDLLSRQEGGLGNTNSAATTDGLNLNQPTPRLSPYDPADFLLHPVEVEKGRRAAQNYLSSFRNDESREKAEEALETLATVISGGKCDSLDFPWQQVRPYHGAAALTILKAKGAPARVEALLCRRDSTRSYRMVPETYPPRQVQKIRSTLSKLIEECCELGFVSDGVEESSASSATSAKAKGVKKPGAKAGKSNSKQKKARTGRSLSTGELRALMAKSAIAANAEGLRDAVFFALVHRGLKIAEITALTVDSVGVSSKTGHCNIIVRPASGGRGRRIELTNEELIYLEDWLDIRGSQDGPLLCTVGRADKIEGKRLTVAALKVICESRGTEAAVQPFTPNDLSRSATDLMGHRRASARKRAKRAQEGANAASDLLFENGNPRTDTEHSEMILFPFLGLSI